MDDPAKHTLESLRAASDTLLYRSLVEQVPAVVYIDSNEHHPRSLYVSPQCVEMFGHTQAEFLADRELWGRCIHPEDRERVFRAWEETVDRQDPFEAEYRWVNPDGAVRWVRDRCVLVRTEPGDPLFWHGLLEDITVSKSIEQALKESMERYRFLVENIPAVVYMVAPDDDRRTLYVSPQVERALGYTRDEWLDQPDIWMELLHPDDREITFADHDEHNETGQPWSQEYRLIASDGRAVWFRDVANLVRDDGGKPLYWLGVQLDVTRLRIAQDDLRAARDDLEHRILERTAELEEANELMMLEISERRRAEEDLRDAERRYRLLAEQIPAVTYIWQTNISGDVERRDYMSPRVEELLGFTAQEWCQTPDFWTSRLHPDDRSTVLAATMRCETTGEPFSMEYRYLHKDGRIVWVLDEAVMILRDGRGRPHQFQGVVIDVTARKEAEARARENEARYRTLAEQVPGIIYVLDVARDELTYVSPQLTTMLGYTPGEWRTTPAWLSKVHESDRERVSRIVSKIRETGEPFVIEYRVLHRDGEVHWVRDQGVVVSRQPSGAPREVQGIMVDVTSARRFEEERERTAALYRRLVERIPAVTFIERPGGRADECSLLYASPQYELVFGHPAEELMADPGHFGRMLHPDDREAVLRANEYSEETGEPFDAEYRIVRDDGRVVWLHSRATLVRDDEGRPLFWHGVALEVTDQRRDESSFRELEELVGRAERDAEGR